MLLYLQSLRVFSSGLLFDCFSGWGSMFLELFIIIITSPSVWDNTLCMLSELVHSSWLHLKSNVLIHIICYSSQGKVLYQFLIPIRCAQPNNFSYTIFLVPSRMKPIPSWSIIIFYTFVSILEYQLTCGHQTYLSVISHEVAQCLNLLNSSRDFHTLIVDMLIHSSFSVLSTLVIIGFYSGS